MALGSEALYWLAGSLCGSKECISGYSGVLFALLTSDCDRGNSKGASVVLFECCQLKLRYIPWITLALWHVLFSGSFTLGNLAGILAGYCLAIMEYSLVGSVWSSFAEMSLTGMVAPEEV